MSRITWKCPKCGGEFLGPASLAGETEPCPKCGKEVTWPTPSAKLPPARPISPDHVPRWIYLVNGVQKGPVSDTQLRAMIEAGMLRPMDLLWREGLNDWIEAQTIPGLFPKSVVLAPADTRPDTTVSPSSILPVPPSATQFALETSSTNNASQRPDSKSSGLGMASFIIAVLVGGLDVMLGLIVILNIAHSRGATETTDSFFGGALALVCLNILSIPLCLVGVGLAIAALIAHKDRSHTMTYIGLGVNALVIFALLGLFVFGSVSKEKKDRQEDYNRSPYYRTR